MEPWHVLISVRPLKLRYIQIAGEVNVLVNMIDLRREGRTVEAETSETSRSD